MLARQSAGDEEPAASRAYKSSHQGARKNWEIPADWPSPAVEEAYVKPRVDAARARFTYGRPDSELLQHYCWAPRSRISSRCRRA